MSFSSAEWTIPELCVWIVTRNRAALNGLSSSVKKSLTYSDMLHNGAYAARDEVIEAAQQGKIIITCAGERDRHRSNPDRTKLSRDFWNNAELVDAGHWQAPGSRWCVARQNGQPNKEYHDLLVDSAKAKEVWSSPEQSVELATAAAAGGGSTSPLWPIAPSGARVPDADPASRNVTVNDTPTDEVVNAYLVLEQAQRIKNNEKCGKNQVRVYLRDEFPHLSRDDIDRFYEALDRNLKPKSGPKRPWKNKPQSP
jgi:hypothetical protein